MPALFVMMEMDAARDARLGLETGNISRDEVLAGAVEHLAEREDRRQDRRRGMPAQGIADIVEIERMRRGAVDERRIERRRPVVAAENETFAARLPEPEHAGGNPGAGLAGAS